MNGPDMNCGPHRETKCKGPGIQPARQGETQWPQHLWSRGSQLWQGLPMKLQGWMVSRQPLPQPHFLLQVPGMAARVLLLLGM